MGEEIKRIKPYRLAVKLANVKILLARTASFIEETGLPDIIKKADSSSFAIVASDRNFYPRIARYSPIEIFELVNPPIIPANAIVLTVTTTNISRSEEFDRYLQNITGERENFLRLSSTKEKRRVELENLRTTQPNKQIFVVWSPVYRYPQNKTEGVIGAKYEFDRPDQDNFPGVTVYTWGY